MCSVNDDCEIENDIVLDKDKSFGKNCRSCSNVAKVVLRRNDPYCQKCFTIASVHKFRAALGKSKMLKPHDRVLVVFTGVHASTSLLHLLHAGLNEEANKRLMFSADVLFIEDGLILQQTLREREEIVQRVKEKAKQFDFKIHVTTLSEVFSETPAVRRDLQTVKCHEDQLEKLFLSVNTFTAKEDLLYRLRHKLTIRVATLMNYTKIFTSEIGSELAVKLLVGISSGRGDQISAEVGFCDARNKDVLVLRPLKDFTHKEIIFYNIFHELEPVVLTSLTSKADVGVSIQKTTEMFVNGLIKDFPSTVYNIFRTGDKLKISEVESSGGDNCALCGGKVEMSNNNCNAIDALEFSKEISQPKIDGQESDLNCCGDGSNVCSCSGSTIECSEIGKLFCYGCQLILKDMGSKDENLLLKSAIQEKNLKMLKSQISEFLIE